MATVNYIRESKQTISAMKGLINYCVQDSKVKDKNSGHRYVSGINCNGENAFNEFMTTKYAYKKVDGFNFYQYVQSFSPRENVTPEQVHKIGLEFAEKAWPGHEVLVATHLDAKHLHNHFVYVVPVYDYIFVFAQTTIITILTVIALLPINHPRQNKPVGV